MQGVLLLEGHWDFCSVFEEGVGVADQVFTVEQFSGKKLNAGWWEAAEGTH